jgi:peptidylprolyl isomerase
MRPRIHITALLGALALVLSLSACGSKSHTAVTNEDFLSKSATTDQTDTTAAPDTTAQAATGPTQAAATSSAPAPATTKITGDTNLSHKPKVAKQTGPAPTSLKVGDIVVGKGPAAKSGDHLTVQYVGVLYKTGKQFDASWDRGQTFPFQLGQGAVIPGWDMGLVGMKVGGRRQLTIPANLAYGSQGQGGIPPNSPLVFVIDLKKIG